MAENDLDMFISFFWLKNVTSKIKNFEVVLFRNYNVAYKLPKIIKNLKITGRPL